MHRTRFIISRFHVLGVSAAVGIGLTYTVHRSKVNAAKAPSHSLLNHIPIQWDSNWDNRQPLCDHDSNDSIDQIKRSAKPTASRIIIMIRHGNYNTSGCNDSERKLTFLGRQQAHLTGKRLDAIMPAIIDNVYYSTMTRATETANIINPYLQFKQKQSCSLIEEGAPIRPEPPLSSYRPDDYVCIVS